ncbi:MAG: hypothetical protein HC903_09600 [Methylacidiphilales bacterium]|nr:hypothetical protein [Candidatus Methylacidiphilales bacterium]NJR15194.1 hypothetical protein [Calothrix sp. CSU_2_0]
MLGIYCDRALHGSFQEHRVATPPEYRRKAGTKYHRSKSLATWQKSR